MVDIFLSTSQRPDTHFPANERELVTPDVVVQKDEVLVARLLFHGERVPEEGISSLIEGWLRKKNISIFLVKRQEEEIRVDSHLQVRYFMARGSLYQVDIGLVLEKRRELVAKRIKVIKPYLEKINIEFCQQFMGYQMQINPVKNLEC